MSILDSGKTPEEWATEMNGRGIPISVRTLRERANRLGACHKIGRAMIITPDQMDEILQEASQKCRSNRISGVQHGGQKVGSSSMEPRSATTTGKALDHLTRLAHKNGVAPKRKGRSAVILLETKRH